MVAERVSILVGAVACTIHLLRSGEQSTATRNSLWNGAWPNSPLSMIRPKIHCAWSGKLINHSNNPLPTMYQPENPPAPDLSAVTTILDPGVRSPGIGRIAFRVILFGLLQKLINMVAMFAATQNGLNHESATSSDLQAFGIVLFVLFAAIICPVVETIALQALPLEVMRNKGVPRPLAILASALLFGLWHAHEGAAKVATTFAVGLMLGWIYERYRNENTIPWVPAVTAAQANMPGFWVGGKLLLQNLFSRISPTGVMYVTLPHVISNTIALVALFAISNSTN